MIKQIKKTILFMILFMAGLTTQCQQSEQDTTALKLIGVLQKIINTHKDTQKSFMNAHDPETTVALMMQINQLKSSFASLLDDYIAHLGQAYEKKAGLFGGYRTSYYISSITDPSLAITPNQYTLLMQTLHDAAQESDWGKTVNLMLPVRSHANHSIVETDLSLNEIIAALKQVPLPARYSTAAIVGGAAATAAAAAGAYYAYNNSDIENYFSPKSTPQQSNSEQAASKQIADKQSSFEQTAPQQAIPAAKAPSIVKTEPSFFQKQLSAMNDESSFLHKLGSEAKTIPGWQAGGDAENYGLNGLSDQEALGAIAVGAGLGAAAQAAGARTAMQYQTAKNTQFIANQQRAILGQPLAQQASIPNTTSPFIAS